MTLDASGNLLLGATSDVLGGNRLLVQSAATANNNRTMSVYNSAATSTTPFANRLFQLAGLGNGADVSLTFTDGVAFNAYIGMTGANLNFSTSSVTTPQMTLNSTGLGIGTSSPAYKLDVAGQFSRIGQSGGAGAGLILAGASAEKNWVIASQYNVSGALEFTQTTAVGGSTISGTPSMVINASGNVGIGTSSPDHKLDINGSLCVDAFASPANNYIALRNSISPSSAGGIGFKAVNLGSGNDDGLGAYGHQGIIFYSAQTERMRISSAGLVGIGTSGPNAPLDVRGDTGTSVSATMRIRGTNATARTTRLQFEDYAGTIVDGLIDLKIPTAGSAASALFQLGINGPIITMDVNGNVGIGTTSPSAPLTVQGNSSGNGINIIGRSTGQNESWLQWYQNNGSTLNSGILGDNQGLKFAVGSGQTERMRIDTSGNLLVGTTTNAINDSNSIVLVTNNGSVVGQVICNHGTGTGSGERFAAFGYAGSAIGSITQSGTTAVLYNVTSDQRLKENIQDADSASSLIDSLQVRKFDWKADSTHQRYGFIAQELVTVAPEAVHQPTDTEEMMAVDYSKLVPMLVKEIQSLRKRLADAGI
jgi:hypothetical protein